MSAAFVRVAPDSTGKLIQTFENSISAQTVEAQAVTNVTSAGVEITTWPVTGTFWQTTQPVSGTFWQTTQPVSIAAQIAVKPLSTTATTSQVADTATNTTLLSSNANRLGATILNDSSAVLYVKFGTTASVTDYTVRMVQYAYFEVPFGYTGRIDGIWATDPNTGSARITELS